MRMKLLGKKWKEVEDMLSKQNLLEIWPLEIEGEEVCGSQGRRRTTLEDAPTPHQHLDVHNYWKINNCIDEHICQNVQDIYIEIYGKAPHHNEVPMFLVKFLYMHFVKGIILDFSSYKYKCMRGHDEAVITHT